MTFELQQYLMNRSRHFLSKNHFVVEDVMKTSPRFVPVYQNTSYSGRHLNSFYEVSILSLRQGVSGAKH